MESEFTQQTHKVYHNSAASLSMEYCQQAVAELDALAEDLRSRIDAAKRSRRNITKLKAALKKEQIQGYQEKMQFALSLLSLSQQTHTMFCGQISVPGIPEPSPPGTRPASELDIRDILGFPGLQSVHRMEGFAQALDNETNKRPDFHRCPEWLSG
ncbi:hypothetical protein CGRA01v4_00513 [Colletotrichum graminicola]|nr:hypothetical protein CGRA01v4_00513 [Colletotrichum graminicola]